MRGWIIEEGWTRRVKCTWQNIAHSVSVNPERSQHATNCPGATLLLCSSLLVPTMFSSYVWTISNTSWGTREICIARQTTQEQEGKGWFWPSTEEQTSCFPGRYTMGYIIPREKRKALWSVFQKLNILSLGTKISGLILRGVENL